MHCRNVRDSGIAALGATLPCLLDLRTLTLNFNCCSQVTELAVAALVAGFPPSLDSAVLHLRATCVPLLVQRSCELLATMLLYLQQEQDNPISWQQLLDLEPAQPSDFKNRHGAAPARPATPQRRVDIATLRASPVDIEVSPSSINSQDGIFVDNFLHQNGSATSSTLRQIPATPDCISARERRPAHVSKYRTLSKPLSLQTPSHERDCFKRKTIGALPLLGRSSEHRVRLVEGGNSTLPLDSQVGPSLPFVPQIPALTSSPFMHFRAGGASLRHPPTATRKSRRPNSKARTPSPHPSADISSARAQGRPPSPRREDERKLNRYAMAAKCLSRHRKPSFEDY
jgi:hypothetical protein